jgi:ankyrin repeat protein
MIAFLNRLEVMATTGMNRGTQRDTGLESQKNEYGLLNESLPYPESKLDDIKITEGVTPLSYLAATGKIDEVRDIVNHPDGKKFLNRPDCNGNSPLHHAMIYDQSKVIKVLVQAGADPNAKNAEGEYPLFSGVKAERVEAVKTLIIEAKKLNVCIDVNLGNNDDETALYQACFNGDLEMVKFLVLIPGVQLDKPNCNGDTPAHAAAFSGCVESLKILHSRGALMDNRNNEERTPFIEACRTHLPNGNVGPLEAFLDMIKEGTVIDVAVCSHAEGDGWTPLIFAVESQCFAAVELLLPLVDAQAKTWALSIAATSGSKKLFARLKEAGAWDPKGKHKANLRRACAAR